MAIYQTGAPIGRIDPVPPTPSLLTVARPLQERDSQGNVTLVPFDRWRTGVSWSPIPAQPSYNWPRCVAQGQPDKAVPEDGNTVVSVDSFAIYTPIECAPIVEGDQLDQDAVALTEAHAAYSVARALWMGDGLPDTNPTLRSEATDITGTSGDTLAQGIASLLKAYEDKTGGNGGATLHIPMELVVAAGSQWLIRQDGNLLRGPLGSNSLVSPGPGYPTGHFADGAAASGPSLGSGAGFAGAAADQAWIYVSGPVEFALGDVRVLPDTELQRRDWYQRNDYHVWAERMAIVRFDVEPVFACLVQNPAQIGIVSP